MPALTDETRWPYDLLAALTAGGTLLGVALLIIVVLEA